MKAGPTGSFGAQLKTLREAAGFTQEELATIAGLSVHAVSALERGHRRKPHVETVRALSAALDLSNANRDALPPRAPAGAAARRAPPRAAPRRRARAAAPAVTADASSSAPLPLSLTVFHGRDADVQTLR